mmetsp:Transcript_43206/g.136343  ORF Transcript_43206/g.136343 Transcript_43206/m.136343 type:complete len:212 (-) Transcript_43206:699-1334(-)
MPHVPSDHSPTTNRTPASACRFKTAASGPQDWQSTDLIPASPATHMPHRVPPGGSNAWYRCKSATTPPPSPAAFAASHAGQSRPALKKLSCTSNRSAGRRRRSRGSNARAKGGRSAAAFASSLKRASFHGEMAATTPSVAGAPSSSETRPASRSRTATYALEPSGAATPRFTAAASRAGAERQRNGNAAGGGPATPELSIAANQASAPLKA